MNFKFPRFVFLAFVSAVFVVSPFFYGLNSVNTVFAEGEVNCNGKIIGKTKASNPNFGQIDFDSHPSPYSDANKVADLSIVGLAPGLAPADRNFAACIDVSSPLVVDEYAVKGFAWNTNLGFYSFFCDGTKKNMGVACGDYTYGTKVGVADGTGKRLLSGNAWNPAFGYMQFAGGGGIPYQVSADVSGKLSGFAWTEAKVWVDMTGVTIQIPGKEIVKEVVGPCDKQPYVCIEVLDPEKALDKVYDGSNGIGGIGVGFGEDPDIKVANGVDEYKIGLYLMDADGVTPMNIANYTIGTITFSWEDTVKINQEAGSNVVNLNSISEPWNQGKGGIIYKPVTVSLSDFDDLGGGHYVLKKTIKSYAPTTDMNISYTTSMKPNVTFKNEVFFNSMHSFADKIPTVEPNRLKLSKIDIPLKDKGTGLSPVGYSQTVYPNGKDGLSFHFRPAVEVSTLYSDNNQDSITGFRSIPFTFKVGGVKDLDLNATASVEFKMDYDQTATAEYCSANGQEVVGGGFDIKFVQDESSTHIWEDVGTDLYSFELQAVATLPGYDALASEEEKAAVKPCSQAAGPTLYSVVKYSIDGKEVSYYSNKLPRIVSVIANPVAVVHGNLYAAKAFSPSADVDVQETGSKSVNILRDGVYENISSKIPGAVLEKDQYAKVDNMKKCTIGDNGGTSACTGQAVGSGVLDGSPVTVYKNTDVHINLSSSSAYSNNQTVVVMNGNIFIDSDIYKKSSTDKMQIIALRPYSDGCNKGNIYISNEVRNLNANMFTDCSVFSYKNGMAFDSVTGIPKWNDFFEMVDSLNKQLRWLGSISSHNTVGGSDLDKDSKNPKTYLLDGFKAWPTVGLTSAQKLDIQAYDLNYLRLFKLSIQTNEFGMPVDQSCQKALTLEEMLQISQGEEVYGDAVDENGDKILCNGIDSLSPYDASSGEGDLIAPIDDSTLAKGLGATDFKPVYVIFSASTSSIFKK